MKELFLTKSPTNHWCKICRQICRQIAIVWETGANASISWLHDTICLDQCLVSLQNLMSASKHNITSHIFQNQCKPLCPEWTICTFKILCLTPQLSLCEINICMCARLMACKLHCTYSRNIIKVRAKVRLFLYAIILLHAIITIHILCSALYFNTTCTLVWM